MITVTIILPRGEEERVYKKGVLLEDIASDVENHYDSHIAAVEIDGKLSELHNTISEDCKVRFFTLRHPIGHKVYVRTATFLFVKSVEDILGKKAKVTVEFAIGDGYYCSYAGEKVLTAEVVEAVYNRMKEHVLLKTNIEKLHLPLEEGLKLFDESGLTEKRNIMSYRRLSWVNVYRMEDYNDYYYGYLMPNAGYVPYFNLEFYENGFMLVLPSVEDPVKVKAFEPRPKLFRTMSQAAEWGEKLGINTVGDLNDTICRCKFNDLVLVQEALQESRISDIAADIVKRAVSSSS